MRVSIDVNKEHLMSVRQPILEIYSPAPEPGFLFLCTQTLKIVSVQ